MFVCNPVTATTTQTQRNCKSNVYILIKISTWGCADKTWFCFIGLNDGNVKNSKYYTRMSKKKYFLKNMYIYNGIPFCKLKGELEVPETQISKSHAFNTLGGF